VTPNRPISDDTLVQTWASLKGFVPMEALSDRAPPPDVDCAPDQPPQAETAADTGHKAESTRCRVPPPSRNEEGTSMG